MRAINGHLKNTVKILSLLLIDSFREYKLNLEITYFGTGSVGWDK
jgi:hypothetical protein